VGGGLRLAAFAAALLLALAAPAARGEERDDQVEALLARMTLEEKIGQLTLLSAGGDFDPELVRQGRVGAVMNFGMPEEIAAINELASQSRLKIPLLVGLDVVHGYRTLFPIPLAEAATFDPDLGHAAAEWSGREAALAGVDWTFGPMADLSRDVRWGRIVEGAGEDVHLLSAFTAARVRGYHAGGLGTTVKHFVGYGAAVGGRDYDAAYIPPAEMRDIYLPPFKAAIDAGTESVMIAYTDLDGLPVAADPDLLKGVLRGELGFEGVVLSDYNVAGELINHGVAADAAEAVRKAFLSGVDMEMQGGLFNKHLADEVRAGRVPLDEVDASVRRVLQMKFDLGLFDQPRQVFTTGEVPPLPEARLVARRIATESMVLLHHRDNVLPIAPATRRIALIGPLAESRRDLNGPHEARAVEADTITYVEGLEVRAAQAGAELTYVRGCADLYCAEPQMEEVLGAADAADLVVAVLGEPRDLTGEGASRAYLRLPGRQYEMLLQLAASGKPVILVLLGGRPLEVGGLLDKIPAILMTWYPGTEAGPALAAILFGDEAPSGKLPHSWPRTVGQAPIHYDRLATGRPTQDWNRFTLKYIDEDIRPQFPFGWGLSTTEFAYSGLTVVTPEIRLDEAVKLRVTIENVGSRAGKEVVQVYVRDPVASRSRPVRQLKAFRKVALAPGESRVVEFAIPARNLGFHQPNGDYVVEPGGVQVWAGGSAAAELGAAFTLID
jgi:beta-glucosidase